MARFSPAVPLIVGAAQFMHQFDGAVITTALPAMAHSLGEDPLKLNLAITCYLLALAVFVPISGWMADKWGAKNIFTAAIVVFSASSMMCGLSHSLIELVIWRTLQGVGGAMMTPVGRVIVVKSVPKIDLVRAMNYITIPAVLGPVLGPSVGGFIVTYFSWPWIFFMNLPISLIGIALVQRYIPHLREEKVPPLDLRGFLLTGTALAGLVFGFSALGRNLLPASVVLSAIGGGVVCGLLYIQHARGRDNAIIDFRLLRIRTFATCQSGGTLFYAGTTSQVFLLALMLQLGFGLTAFQAGLVTLGNAFGSVVMRFTFQPFLKMLGFRSLMISVALVNAAVLATCGLFSITTPIWLIVCVLVISGFCRSSQFTAVQSLNYADMPTDKMSRATSFSAMMQQLAQSIGVGLSAIVVHLSLLYHGHAAISANDVSLGFYFIGFLSLVSGLIFYRRLPLDAGSELTRRK